AASMVEPRFRGRAVSSVMLGLAVANVAGVPASTWLGQNLGWRSAYWTVVVLTVLTAIAIRFLVPKVEGDKSASVGRELNALRQPQVLFTVAAGMVGFGGMFAMYSYIAPTVTDVTGLSRSAIPWFLFAFGLGGLAGTAIGGRLADFSVIKSLVGGFLAMAVLLALFVVGASYAVSALFLVFAISAAGSLVAVCLQMRLMDVAGEAKMLGAALNHSALNLANGLGAYLGAVVISAGYGYTAPSKVGVGLALGGLAILGVSIVHSKRTRTRELVGASV
ncbi:MAG: transporter, partial [Nocardioidaceae bacterium]|nr:transporter [Nocardioidaceae bacterium]